MIKSTSEIVELLEHKGYRLLFPDQNIPRDKFAFLSSPGYGRAGFIKYNNGDFNTVSLAELRRYASIRKRIIRAIINSTEIDLLSKINIQEVMEEINLLNKSTPESKIYLKVESVAELNESLKAAYELGFIQVKSGDPIAEELFLKENVNNDFHLVLVTSPRSGSYYLGERNVYDEISKQLRRVLNESPRDSLARLFATLPYTLYEELSCYSTLYDMSLEVDEDYVNITTEEYLRFPINSMSILGKHMITVSDREETNPYANPAKSFDGGGYSQPKNGFNFIGGKGQITYLNMGRYGSGFVLGIDFDGGARFSYVKVPQKNPNAEVYGIKDFDDLERLLDEIEERFLVTIYRFKDADYNGFKEIQEIREVSKYLKDNRRVVKCVKHNKGKRDSRDI